MTVPWKRIGSGALDVLVFLAAVCAALVALWLAQFVMGAVDGVLDGLAGRVVQTDCDPRGCWPH